MGERDRRHGRIEAIAIGAEPGAPLDYVQEVNVRAGHGIEGDRTFSEATNGNAGRDLTLIEAEALEALATEAGIVIEQRDARRNLITRGISLNGLVGRRFRVGPLECIGIELCEPCAHLESLTQPGVIKGLVHRGGLNAAVVAGGTVAVGDEVTAL